MSETGEKPIAGMSFEEALDELDRIVNQLEKPGAVTLDQSIELYERGEKLREICEKRLRDAEMRVEKILVNKDGEASETAPLDEQKPAPSGGPDDEIPF